MSTSSISSAASATSTSSTSSSGGDALNNVSVNDFLKLLLAELQHQDPLDPTNSNEILQQVSQIKAIQSNQQLTDTLSSMQIQQNLMAAGFLLQKNITGLTDSGDTISGTVDKVTIANNTVKAGIGDQTISLKNITKIDPSDQ